MKHVAKSIIIILITLPVHAKFIEYGNNQNYMANQCIDYYAVPTLPPDSSDTNLFPGPSQINAVEIRRNIQFQYIDTMDYINNLEKRKNYVPNNESEEDTSIKNRGLLYFLLGNTMLGSFYYGPELAEILKPAGCLPEHACIFAAAASFLLPYTLTRNINVTEASAHLSVFGGIAGIFHGYLVSELLGITDISLRRGIPMMASIAENIGLFSLAASTGMTSGKADVMQYYSILGTAHGYGWNYLFGIGEKDNYWPVAPLIGSLGGLVAGNFVANTQHYTSGDATMAFLPSVLSAYFTSSLLFAFGNDMEGELFCLANIVSTGLGAFAGNEMVRGYDFSVSSANYAILGTIGGAIAGLAVGVYKLIEEVEEGEEGIDIIRLLPFASSVGAIAGYMAVFDARKGTESESDSNNGLSLVVSPAGIADGLAGDRKSVV